MCCGFVMPMGHERIDREVLAVLEKRHTPVKTGDIYPGDRAAVLAANRQLVPGPFAMRFGYRLPDGKLVFNARSETAAQKPMFADGMARRRCLIPAVRYYEWQRSEAGKQKFAISPADTELLFLGGLYRMEGTEPVFTVLTRPPVEELAVIHDRMPVIIPEEAGRDWLNPRYHGADLLREFCPQLEFTPV